MAGLATAGLATVRSQAAGMTAAIPMAQEGAARQRRPAGITDGGGCGAVTADPSRGEWVRNWILLLRRRAEP